MNTYLKHAKIAIFRQTTKYCYHFSVILLLSVNLLSYKPILHDYRQLMLWQIDTHRHHL